ncbi:MAG: hypothetical protein QM805_07820 [Pseudomonas sp.]
MATTMEVGGLSVLIFSTHHGAAPYRVAIPRPPDAVMGDWKDHVDYDFIFQTKLSQSAKWHHWVETTSLTAHRIGRAESFGPLEKRTLVYVGTKRKQRADVERELAKEMIEMLVMFSIMEA